MRLYSLYKVYSGTIISPSKILLMCLGLRKNMLAVEGLGLFALRFVDFGEASLAGLEAASLHSI